MTRRAARLRLLYQLAPASVSYASPTKDCGSRDEDARQLIVENLSLIREVRATVARTRLLASLSG